MPPGHKHETARFCEGVRVAETMVPKLSRVAETSLITLYLRAVEAQRPDALMKDMKAVEIVRQLDQDSLRRTLDLTEDTGRVVMILKSREFDRIALDFSQSNPGAVIVHLGCGLDTRFDRVDDGRLQWFDLDLPEVMELRRQLIGGESDRYHSLACSVFDQVWLDTLSSHQRGPTIFIAEGLFEYFHEDQVKWVVLAIKGRFQAAQLVFDAYSPFMLFSHNLRVARTKVGAPLQWALKHPRDLERWGDGVRLLDSRYPFQSLEPRLQRALKAILVPFIATGIGVYYFQL